ncbi:4'-phosphopantetheinyl transferase family protein [Aquimarina aquimarini]|uniref:4'-phosphopantetheinyl transferase family protein n=1 Tax=Aquimarina aquimarini TaxID=1191734 RepID=UPI000D555899|nr:4'-phosphopantetheinyl transferase superfamily protein [Aquimarina aquimarini]
MTQILYSYIHKENHEYLLQNIALDFPVKFYKKILRYRRWQDAQLSLLGRVLLDKGCRNINRKINQEKIQYTAYGKPYVEEGGVKFNISHSGNMVVCVVTEGCEVGVDIEVVRDIDIHDFKSQMTTLEWQKIISSQDSRNSFFEYWTQKEAVIKAHGMGLSIPLKSFEIDNNQTNIEGIDFFTKEINIDDGYRCYLAFDDQEAMLGMRYNMINVDKY